jgi:hypothetical protein
VELGDFTFGLKVLERAADGRVGQTDGDGAEGVRVEVSTGLEDID